MSLEKKYEVVGRLIVNPEFRDSFFEDPEKAISKFNISSITPDELDDLKHLKKERISAAYYALGHVWITLIFAEDLTPDYDDLKEHITQLWNRIKKLLEKKKSKNK